MLRHLYSIRVVLFSVCFIALGALAGAIAPVQATGLPGGPGVDRCLNQHRCEGGSEGACEATMLNRFCEYSPSGLCSHWTGSCPIN